MKDNVIILDLDDTLISTPYRQYSCINDYLISGGKEFVDFDSYINLRKSQNLSNINLLKSMYQDIEWDVYREFYLKNIEAEKYLILDKLIVKKQLLAEVAEKEAKLILLSLRSNHQNSLNQLQHLGIDSFFSEIYFEHHSLKRNAKVARLDQLKADNNIIAFCGDAISDYEAAQLLNIKFVQVKTSLYNFYDFEDATQYKNINKYLLSIT